MNHKRVFIALDIPEEVRDEIERCQIGIPTAKWTKKENLHLTLEFLGEIPLDLFEHIREILREVQGKRFRISLQEPNVFIKKQKILWLKAIPNEPVIALRNEIIKLLQKYKIPLSKPAQNFIPHVTIARMDVVNQRKLNEYLLSFEGFTTMEFDVVSFFLYSSILHPHGSIYTKEEEYALF
ncbi:MAG: RNA 2',3'-cyclic phosphodiesterase [Leptospiraceae bacterium]|nr:RNA 2',3'-cyclic phosphodiesterase [Leptospiraceae bacterium]MDW7975507.1 RNA 2',3'-cyclic phosphodiesterase [Leptospiraceae bacterium]